MSYINRSIEPVFKKIAQEYPVVTLIGPRQSGKTSLVQYVFPEKPYVSLENPDERAFAEGDPKRFLAQFPDGAILDEIQRLPMLLSYIQGIVDQRKDQGMFFLTGSHQPLLHQSITQSLAGRTALLTLLPFQFSELPIENQTKSLDDYLYQGMYPRVYDRTLQPTQFYRNYFQTYVERDVRSLLNVKDLSRFSRFVKLCASRIGQLFNASQIGSELGISSNTTAEWLSILEASYIVFRLNPYFENFGKRLIKSSKIYFYDVGLAAYCLDIHQKEQLSRDPLRGQLVENFWLLEWIKNRLNRGLEPNAYFYRDSNQHEVDLIVKSGHQLIPIEFKSGETFHPDFLKGLEYFKTIAGDRCAQGYLVYAGQREQELRHTCVRNWKSLTELSNSIQ
jgi:predicted AAA+ superfamily ATPase